MKILFSTTLFLHLVLSSAMAEIFPSIKPFLPAPQASIKHPVFSEYPGVDAKDLEFTYTKSEEEPENPYAPAQVVELGIMQQLNIEARQVWSELKTCYGDQLEELRHDYLNRSLRCGEKSLVRFHLNVRNWLETTAMRVTGNDILKNPRPLAPVHPLLSQIIVEGFSYYKYHLSHIMYTAWNTIDNLDVSLKHSVCENYGPEDKDYDECQEILPFSHGYIVTTNLLSSWSRSCLNFGFWPNATFFLYAYHYYEGYGVTDHPTVTEQYRGFSFYNFTDADFDQPASCWGKIQSVEREVSPLIRDFSDIRHYEVFMSSFAKVYMKLWEHYSKRGKK